MVTVAFPRIKKTPDPTQIISTSDWYFLDQVSSSLIKWDHTQGKYIPLIAKSWSVSDHLLTFELNPDAKFSDQTPITAIDVAASIKRSIIKKTSTHFKPWELLAECNSLKSMIQNCKGIEIVSDRKIKFHLSRTSESFFLFLASPEGGIWSADDLKPSLELFSPSKFSGAYAVKVTDIDKNLELVRNNDWVLDSEFSNRIDAFNCVSAHGDELTNLVLTNKVDLLMEAVRPFFIDYTKENRLLRREKSAFNTLIYLFKVGSHNKAFDSKSLSLIWQKKYNDELAPAEDFLPYSSLSGVSKDQILNLLPMDSNPSEKLRIGILKGYFTQEFVDFLFGVPNKNKFEIVEMSFDDWVAAYSLDYSKDKVDFVLTPYVASERYPSVQINFLLEGKKLPFDIEVLDRPGNHQERDETLKRVQSWMIQTQTIIPLVFTRNHIIFSKKINLGRQPLTDSELHLWRIGYE